MSRNFHILLCGVPVWMAYIRVGGQSSLDNPLLGHLMALRALFTDTIKKNSGLLKAEPLLCCPRGTHTPLHWGSPLVSLLIAPQKSMRCPRVSLSSCGLKWVPDATWWWWWCTFITVFNTNGTIRQEQMGVLGTEEGSVMGEAACFPGSLLHLGSVSSNA